MTLTDTLWNHFNKRHEWLFRDADTIRTQDRAIAASGTVDTRASPEPQEGLGHSASVNYRKGISHDTD